MEIILKTDVENLGYKDQIVSVKPGYANNFLIPQGIASAATVSAKKAHSEILRQRAHKETKMISDAQAIVAKLEAMVITMKVKANDGGRIFGTITTTDIAEAVKVKGLEIDKRAIKVAPIKEVGSHTATVRIYKEVSATVKIEVVSEAAPAAPVAAE